MWRLLLLALLCFPPDQTWRGWGLLLGLSPLLLLVTVARAGGPAPGFWAGAGWVLPFLLLHHLTVPVRFLERDRWLLYALYALLTAVASQASAPARRGVCRWLALLGGVTGLYAGYQVFFGLPALYTELGPLLPLAPDPGLLHARLTQGRAFATFLTPSALAGYLAVTLPVTLALRAGETDRRRRGLLLAAAGGQLSGFTLTHSLSGLVALGLAAASIAVLGGWRGRWRGRYLGFVALGGGLLVLLGLVRGTESLAPFTQRWENWSVAWRMLRRFPLTGVGEGGYGVLYPQFMGPGMNESRFVHNSYLQLAAENGPWVLLLLVLLLIPLVGAIHRAWRPEGGGDPLTRGAAFACLTFLWHNLFDFTWYLPGVTVPVLFLAGGLIGSPAPAEGRVPRPRGLALGTVAAVLVLGIPSLAGRAAFDLGTAAHDEGRPAAAGRWLERAVRWDPGQPTYHAYRGQFLAEAGTGDRTAVEAALTELETARRLDPATPYYHFLLGGFYGQVGDPLQAALNYRRAATLFPLNPEYRRAVKASDPSESAP